MILKMNHAEVKNALNRVLHEGLLDPKETEAVYEALHMISENLALREFKGIQIKILNNTQACVECAVCGHVLDRDMRYCPECGSNLGDFYDKAYLQLFWLENLDKKPCEFCKLSELGCNGFEYKDSNGYVFKPICQGSKRITGSYEYCFDLSYLDEDLILRERPELEHSLFDYAENLVAVVYCKDCEDFKRQFCKGKSDFGYCSMGQCSKT